MDLQGELGGYEIVDRLARGGMAEVYRARALPTTQRSPDEPDEVVVKRLHPAYAADTGFVQQFVEEARLTSKLRHPNVVRTFRCFRSGTEYLMVQELVAGRTLASLQDAHIKSGTPMPREAANYIALNVLRALEYIHRVRVKIGDKGSNIVHRDVNPANVLLSGQGEVKLTDFGVADVDGMMRGESGALRGTLAYMSPEQVLGQAVDRRTDLFAVGVMLWEMWANRRLYSAANDLELMPKVRDARIPALSTVVPDLPEYAVRVVRKALFADRTHRFQSATEFSKALESLAARAGWKLGSDALEGVL